MSFTNFTFANGGSQPLNGFVGTSNGTATITNIDPAITSVFYNLGSTYVLPATDDDVRDPVGDRQVPVRVEDAYVARVVPAIVVERLCREPRIGVSEEAFGST